MAILQSLTQSTPANGETVTLYVGPGGGTFAMPATDSGNTAVAITNSGNATASLDFGTVSTLPASAGMPGLFTVPVGQTVLVDGTAGTAAGTATYVSAAPQGGNAVLSVQRGTITTVQLAGLMKA